MRIRHGLWLMLMVGCAGPGEDDPFSGAEHAHNEATYPATPAETPLPLKSAEFPGARYLQARWYTPGRSRAIDTIVIHTTEGRYSGTVSWFQSPRNNFKTSAHYVIRSSDGEITQMVKESDTAHHVRGYNSRSIGLEHEAFIKQRKWYTDAMYRASARLVRSLCQKHNIPMDRQHIRSHAELDPNRRKDPGRYWDWDKYMAMVRDGVPGGGAAAGGGQADAACQAGLWHCSASRNARQRCQNGAVAETERCGGGCQVMPVGQDDLCRPASEGPNRGVCTANGNPGICIDEGRCPGIVTANLCPGANHIKCCTEERQAPQPPAQADNHAGEQCTVNGNGGTCVALINAGSCAAPKSLAPSADCGRTSACCGQFSDGPNDPPPNDPPPNAPPPNAPPPNGGQCTHADRPGTCMTFDAAWLNCPWPANEGWETPECAELCCIPMAQAEPPPPEPDNNDRFEDNWGACQAQGQEGICVPTANCRVEGGTSTRGRCPGPNDVQCCTF